MHIFVLVLHIEKKLTWDFALVINMQCLKRFIQNSSHRDRLAAESYRPPHPRVIGLTIATAAHAADTRHPVAPMKGIMPEIDLNGMCLMRYTTFARQKNPRFRYHG